MEKENKNFKLKKEHIAIIIAAIVVVFLFIFIKNGNDQGKFYTGSLSEGSKTTEEKPNLFYFQNGRYMINMDQLDDLISVSVIKSDSSYNIVTSFNQLSVDSKDRNYKFNYKEVSDKSWLKPTTMKNNAFYADANAIFNTLGYDITYILSADKTSVIGVIERSSGSSQYQFNDIDVVEKGTKKEVANAPQVEESAIDGSNVNDNTPNNGDMKTVPQPDKNQVDLGPNATTSTVNPILTNSGSGETAKDGVIKYENGMTDEDYEKIWNTYHDELKTLWSNSASNVRQKAFNEFDPNFISYNWRTGAILYDTIEIVKNTVDDSNWLILQFSNDWSDFAQNCKNESSKAFYAGVPEVYRRTMIDVLGEKTGQELFDYIKPFADRTTTIKDVVWGDGVMASQIDFTNWQNRRTDSGIRFCVYNTDNTMWIELYKE